MLIHSHRHNKKEEFLVKQADKLDFSVVRDTMYKYSKKAQQRFFSHPVLAFLFGQFALHEEGERFIRNKFKAKGTAYCDRILSEIRELGQEASAALKKGKDTKCTFLYRSL